MGAWSHDAHLLLSSFAASSFVLVLYLIPSRIRALPRDDLLHVSWKRCLPLSLHDTSLVLC